MKSQFTDRLTKSLLGTIILSICYHAGIVLSLYLTSAFIPKVTPQPVAIDFLSAEEMAQLRKSENPKNKTEVLANQIVQQKKSVREERDEKARFLSEKDQKVEKQTQAAARGEFKNSLQKAAKSGAPSKTENKQQVVAVKDLFKSYDANEGIERAQKKSAPVAPKNPGTIGTDLAQGEGLEQSQTDDYIKNVDHGLQTLLNTREFKYYSYYDRIRKQLAQHWESKVREKLTHYYKTNRAPASVSQDRTTKVVVILNSAGNLVRVQVVGVSGVEDLDEAATDAFRAAAPFPNPPKGILEMDGTVKIRWDFVLEA